MLQKTFNMSFQQQYSYLTNQPSTDDASGMLDVNISAGMYQNIQPDTAPFQTLVESVLPMQVDCVAWCRKLKWVVAVGAYQLDAEKGQRVGRVYLVVVKPDVDKVAGSDPMTTSVCEEVVTLGVLDLKWEPQQENILAVATSNSVIIYQLGFENNQPILEKYKELVLEKDTMALYIEWMNPRKLCIGDSTGSVQILEFTDVGPLLSTVSTKLHDYLVWVVHYNPKTDTFYSGADDGKFMVFYLKDLKTPANRLMKKFDVGVTSITTYKQYVALGSYDENLRIYIQTPGDNKPCLTMKCVVGLGGAVWRTHWIPENLFQPYTQMETDLIIGASCARNGIHFVRVNAVTWAAEVVLSCEKHVGPLAYGFDVRPESETQSLMVASCYFDSHLLHFWEIQKSKLGLL